MVEWTAKRWDCSECETFDWVGLSWMESACARWWCFALPFVKVGSHFSSRWLRWKLEVRLVETRMSPWSGFFWFLSSAKRRSSRAFRSGEPVSICTVVEPPDPAMVHVCLALIPSPRFYPCLSSSLSLPPSPSPSPSPTNGAYLPSLCLSPLRRPPPPPPPPPTLSAPHHPVHATTDGFSTAHASKPAVAKMKMKTTASSLTLSRWKHVAKTSSSLASAQMGSL
jgi:hypothetical protein